MQNPDYSFDRIDELVSELGELEDLFLIASLGEGMSQPALVGTFLEGEDIETLAHDCDLKVGKYEHKLDFFETGINSLAYEYAKAEYEEAKATWFMEAQ